MIGRASHNFQKHLLNLNLEHLEKQKKITFGQYFSIQTGKVANTHNLNIEAFFSFRSWF